MFLLHRCRLVGGTTEELGSSFHCEGQLGLNPKPLTIHTVPAKKNPGFRSVPEPVRDPLKIEASLLRSPRAKDHPGSSFDNFFLVVLFFWFFQSFRLFLSYLRFLRRFCGFLRVFWRVVAGVLLRTERCGKLRRFAARNATKTKATRKKFPFEVPGY